MTITVPKLMEVPEGLGEVDYITNTIAYEKEAVGS